jgi:hypothetical protein
MQQNMNGTLGTPDFDSSPKHHCATKSEEKGASAIRLEKVVGWRDPFHSPVALLNSQRLNRVIGLRDPFHGPFALPDSQKPKCCRFKNKIKPMTTKAKINLVVLTSSSMWLTLVSPIIHVSNKCKMLDCQNALHCMAQTAHFLDKESHPLFVWPSPAPSHKALH